MDGDEDLTCTAEEDIELCTATARRYGLKLNIIDLHRQYWDNVVAYAIDKVKRGLTPNPDVMCNKLIKFGCFEQEAGHLYDKTATGHYAGILEKDGKIYIPFSELAQNVYNVEIEHKESTDRVVIDSLDRELKKADSKKNIKVKYKAKKFSKTLAKVKQGEKVVVISQDEKWSKIRTENGIVGYVKNKTIANLTYVRENMEETKQINGKVNLVWDYYSEYALSLIHISEPTRH